MPFLAFELSAMAASHDAASFGRKQTLATVTNSMMAELIPGNAHQMSHILILLHETPSSSVKGQHAQRRTHALKPRDSTWRSGGSELELQI
mmetsp:Transcript_8915/g.24844  ORF Transcript_8915/g.24844 Transcript_8915/m.24844 type:complete len:91 (+) Transcript_8915:936-1208(+)